MNICYQRIFRYIVICNFSLIIFSGTSVAQNIASVRGITGQYIINAININSNGSVITQFQTDDGLKYYLNAQVYNESTQKFTPITGLSPDNNFYLNLNNALPYVLSTLIWKFAAGANRYFKSGVTYYLVPHIIMSATLPVTDTLEYYLWNQEPLQALQATFPSIKTLQDFLNLPLATQIAYLSQVNISYAAFLPTAKNQGNLNPVPPSLPK